MKTGPRRPGPPRRRSGPIAACAAASNLSMRSTGAAAVVVTPQGARSELVAADPDHHAPPRPKSAAARAGARPSPPTSTSTGPDPQGVQEYRPRRRGDFAGADAVRAALARTPQGPEWGG